MENKTEKKKLPAFVILAIIALVSALALGFTNAITEGPIEKLAQEELAASFSQVMPAAAYDTLEVPAEYKDVNSLAAAKDESGNVVGYAVKASQQGYAGPVAVILGVDPKGKVTSAQIGDASFQETNGFGARWKEEANVNRLVGLDAVNGGAFEAISGATYTSKAVLGSTNAALTSVAKVAMGVEEIADPLVVNGAPTASADGGEGEAAALTPGATLAGTAEGFGGGMVNVTVKLDDSANIASVQVDAASQTPGIGQNCESADFTDQFVGKAIPVALGEGIDAVAGATITSTAVVDAINKAKPESPVKPGATLEGSANGFADAPVNVKVTLDDNANIATLKVDAASQTPGIGQNCEGADFTDQFIGKAIPLTLGEDVDALTGATITSTAVVNAINGAHGVESAPAVEAVTVLTEDENGSLGVTDSGAVKIVPAEGFTGTLLTELAVENGKVVNGTMALPTAVPVVEEPAVTEAPAAEEPAAEPAEAPAAAGAEKTAKIAAFDGQEITVTATLDDSNTITALTVDASTQTPGLGQKCAEEDFTKQFIGKTLPVKLGEGIDAVASATITSTAVVDALNSLADEAAPAEEAAPAAEEPAEAPAAAAEKTAKIAAFDGQEITVTATLDDSNTITALTVDASTQTPGLGQKCAEEDFTKQFIGKTLPVKLGEGIDAVASATITSTAVVDALNSLAGEAAPAEEAAEPAAAEPAEAPAAAAEKTAKIAAFNGQEITVTATLDGSNTITALTVDASTQTPGLGQKCAEEDFTKQFIGKTLPVKLGEGIDAVASATITSTAVVDALNSLAN